MEIATAKRILQHPQVKLALYALSAVNLKDKEWKVLVLRYLRGMTQEEAAEELDRSKNCIQNWEKAALIKCVKVWEAEELRPLVEYMEQCQ